MIHHQSIIRQGDGSRPHNAFHQTRYRWHGISITTKWNVRLIIKQLIRRLLQFLNCIYGRWSVLKHQRRLNVVDFKGMCDWHTWPISKYQITFMLLNVFVIRMVLKTPCTDRMPNLCYETLFAEVFSKHPHIWLSTLHPGFMVCCVVPWPVWL